MTRISFYIANGFDDVARLVDTYDNVSRLVRRALAYKCGLPYQQKRRSDNCYIRSISLDDGAMGNLASLKSKYPDASKSRIICQAIREYYSGIILNGVAVMSPEKYNGSVGRNNN